MARASIDEAKRRMQNIVIIDTAGRLGIDEEMMQQAAAIRDAVDPDEILFVVDAMIGQDAVTTAQAFLDGVGYDGVVLTKLDGDARGGAALSIAQLTGKPVMFASSGEKLEDFDVFHPDRMASRILDLGDILTLIEQAERTFDQDQAAAMAEKLASGEGFTLEDFVEQLAMVRKLGPIGNLLGHAARRRPEPGDAQPGQRQGPGPGGGDRELDDAVEERRNPKIINGSRRARIAAGSGVTVGEVSPLITRFLEGQKMMRQMMGMPGMRRGAQKARARRRRSPRAGAPGGGVATAARDRRARRGFRPGNGPAMPGSIPGLPDGFGAGDGGFKLPPGFGGPQPNLPPGLRGPVPNRRGRPGKKGR